VLKTKEGGDGGTARLCHARLSELRKSGVDDLECLVEKIRDRLLGGRESSIQQVLRGQQSTS
jgi:hypothetical protein